MAEKSRNLTLIHAPAGSGKTTKIEKYLIEKTRSKEFTKKILCITYTNRAAEELQRRIENPIVDIFTIHSFLSNFLKNHHKEEIFINEYYSLFKRNIELELKKYNESEKQNPENKDNFTFHKWREFKEKHGEVVDNIQLKKIWLEDGIKYNERIWSNYLFGEISHDDLLKFTEVCFRKIPKLRERLTSLYEEIIIDEYQDTDPSIITAFYYAVKDSKTHFKLIGDEMQNIYGASHFKIREILKEFNLDRNMLINYRSSTEIVDILNKVYNDKFVKQTSNMGEIGIKPRLFISDEINDFHKKYPEYLLLVPTIREVLSSASELYEEYRKLAEYKHNNSKNIKLTDVLNFEKSVDPLIEILNQSTRMLDDFSNEDYTSALSTYMKNKIVKEKVIKKEILNDFRLLENFRNQKGDSKIRDYINLLESLCLWKKEIELIDKDKYQFILDSLYINYQDGKRNYLNSSTQHGVKGESHKKVIVYLKNNPHARVYMKDFLKCWSTDESLNLATFENLIEIFNECPIQKKIKNLEDKKEEKNLTKVWHDKHQEELRKQILLFKEKYKTQKMIKALTLNLLQNYLDKPNISNYKKMIVGNKLEDKIDNVAMTYKLFYVVLSRAQEDLIVVLDKDLENHNVIERFMSIGFKVQGNN